MFTIRPRIPILMATSTLALVLAASAMPANAGKKHKARHHDYAKVLRVDPIYTEVRVEVPRRECWDEQVVREVPDRRRHESYTPHIVGGILGGVLGNQFGQGTGNTLTTVAGALLGGSVGRDTAARHRGGHGGYRSYATTETRCTTRTEYRIEERLDGYRVKYRYHGRVYHTRTDYDPGDRIRVRVDVRPQH